jgi:hypothetical protein
VTAAPDPTPARRLDAALHLLDRQIVDPDDRMVAKVDDVELAERSDGRLVVTALLTGPGALGPRLGGSLGSGVVAVWRRLRADAEPRPGRIDMADVVALDRVVRVGRRREQVGVDGLERWVRERVVSRLPGAGHDPG